MAARTLARLVSVLSRGRAPSPNLLRSTPLLGSSSRLDLGVRSLSLALPINGRCSPSSFVQAGFSTCGRRKYSAEAARPGKRFREFELDGRVFVVTGGAQGLGLTLAEVVVEAGGIVYCLDRRDEPSDAFFEAKERVGKNFGGTLEYRRVDVSSADDLDGVISGIADQHSRLDGLLAAAGVQNVVPALEYPPHKITEMMDINFKGVMLSAVSCARQMIKYKCPGSMLLVGSMSGLIANKGFNACVYNSSKAAVIQLGRNLAMEWGKVIDGRSIRVNVLCPGNIITPMVRKNFEDDPELKPLWERENMMGRISEPHEYRGAALFMLSDASSFMTGSHLVIDGGYTAW